MDHPQVYILERDAKAGAWIRDHLSQVGIAARWFAAVSDLLSESEQRAPVVCLITLHQPATRVLALITELIQEPRFAQTAFIIIGPVQHKHAAFEAGADDYVVVPPDAIELRKRVRLHLDRATLEARLVAETRLSHEMAALSVQDDRAARTPLDPESISLLEHAAAQIEARTMFEMIVQHAGSAMAFAAPDGALIHANPAWKRLFPPSNPGAPPGFGWPPETTDPATTHTIAAAIDAPAAWQDEACFVVDELNHRDLALSVTPAFDAAHDLIGFVLVQTDASQQQALRDLKARFVADAAAALRTPVTNIMMRQFLLREATPDQRAMHLQALARESQRLADMVDAMLELARLDAGTEQMLREPLNLRRLAQEAVTRYSPAAEHSGVTLALAAGPDLPDIAAAHDSLARVLGILIENAIQHTPEAGHITVRVSADTRSGKAYQTVQVQDNGMGIAHDALPFLFDRYYRGQRTRDAGIRGSGLGLAIAQEVVHRHGGAVTVDSAEHNGSQFTVWLPAG